MSEERRREPRLDASSLGLFVYDNLRGELLGTLVNLSRGGLMVLSGTGVDRGGVLQIDLRDRAESKVSQLSMGVQVSWVTPANTEGNYWIGARIIAISEEDTVKLKALLQQAQADNGASGTP